MAKNKYTIRTKEFNEGCSVCGLSAKKMTNYYFRDYDGSYLVNGCFSNIINFKGNIICQNCIFNMAIDLLGYYGVENYLKQFRYDNDKYSSTRKLRKIITSKLRMEVHKKLGFKCLKCGSEEDIHLDHIIPDSKGGETSLDNLQPLCRKCNISKGIKIIDYRNEK
jgi:hypothetical protein